MSQKRRITAQKKISHMQVDYILAGLELETLLLANRNYAELEKESHKCSVAPFVGEARAPNDQSYTFIAVTEGLVTTFIGIWCPKCIYKETSVGLSRVRRLP